MVMERESFVVFPEEIKKCLEDCGVAKVEFKTEYSEELFNKPVSEFLPLIVSELTDNCKDKGAKNIYITLSDTNLRVEDDVIEKNPEKTLKFLNQIIESGKRTTTKDNKRKTCGECPGGGMGIAQIVMGVLGKHRGNLEYHIKDGRIVAEVTWG